MDVLLTVVVTLLCLYLVLSIATGNTPFLLVLIFITAVLLHIRIIESMD